MEEDLRKLVAGISAADVLQRRTAAERMCQLGPSARSAATALVRATADDDETVREWAVAALEELGVPDEAALDELSPLTAHPKQDVAYWAVTLLARFKDRAARCCPAMVKTLQTHASLAVRQRAAWALGQIGVDNESVLEALRAASHEENRRLSRLAERAIQQIEPPPGDN